MLHQIAVVFLQLEEHIVAGVAVLLGYRGGSRSRTPIVLVHDPDVLLVEGYLVHILPSSSILLSSS